MKIILLSLIIVLKNEALIQVKPNNDSPVLMKILQSVDSATSDEHLFEVALKLLKSLCVCMRETLKQKEEKLIFNGDTNSLLVDELVTDGKDLEIYRNIYNNTCFHLRQELANKINNIQNITIDNEVLNEYVNGGKNTQNNTENGIDKISTNGFATLDLQNILYKALIQTKDFHNYYIKRYNLFGKAKPHVHSNLKHSVIVIVTLHPLHKRDNITQDITAKELYDILHQKSSIDIDIIDAKYDPNDRASEEYAKDNIVSDCNLRSVYTFLIESENKKLTKVSKVLRRNGTIKIYIDVSSRSNHTDFSKICCENNTITSLCKTEFLNSSLETEEIFDNTNIETKKKPENYKDTITKIKKLVNLYDKKLKTVASGALDKTELDNVNESECLANTDSILEPKYEIIRKIQTNVADAKHTIRIQNMTLTENDKEIPFNYEHNNTSPEIYKKDLTAATLPILKDFVTSLPIKRGSRILNKLRKHPRNNLRKPRHKKDHKSAESKILKEIILKYIKPVSSTTSNNNMKKYIKSIYTEPDTQFLDSNVAFTGNLLATTDRTTSTMQRIFNVPNTEIPPTLILQKVSNKYSKQPYDASLNILSHTLHVSSAPDKVITNKLLTQNKFQSNKPDYKTTNDLSRNTNYLTTISTSIHPVSITNYNSSSDHSSWTGKETLITTLKIETAKPLLKDTDVHKSNVTMVGFIPTEGLNITKLETTTKSMKHNSSKSLKNVAPVQDRKNVLTTPKIEAARSEITRNTVKNTDIKLENLTTGNTRRNIQNNYYYINDVSDTTLRTKTSTDRLETKKDLNNFTELGQLIFFSRTQPQELFTDNNISTRSNNNVTNSNIISKIKSTQNHDVSGENERIVIPIRQVITRYKTKPIIIDNLFVPDEINNITTPRLLYNSSKTNSNAIKSLNPAINSGALSKNKLMTFENKYNTVTIQQFSRSQSNPFRETTRMHTTFMDTNTNFKEILSNLTSGTTSSPIKTTRTKTFAEMLFHSTNEPTGMSMKISDKQENMLNKTTITNNFDTSVDDRFQLATTKMMLTDIPKTNPKIIDDYAKPVTVIFKECVTSDNIGHTTSENGNSLKFDTTTPEVYKTLVHVRPEYFTTNENELPDATKTYPTTLEDNGISDNIDHRYYTSKNNELPGSAKPVPTTFKEYVTSAKIDHQHTKIEHDYSLKFDATIPKVYETLFNVTPEYFTTNENELTDVTKTYPATLKYKGTSLNIDHQYDTTNNNELIGSATPVSVTFKEYVTSANIDRQHNTIEHENKLKFDITTPEVYETLLNIRPEYFTTNENVFTNSEIISPTVTKAYMKSVNLSHDNTTTKIGLTSSLKKNSTIFKEYEPSVEVSHKYISVETEPTYNIKHYPMLIKDYVTTADNSGEYVTIKNKLTDKSNIDSLTVKNYTPDNIAHGYYSRTEKDIIASSIIGGTTKKDYATLRDVSYQYNTTIQNELTNSAGTHPVPILQHQSVANNTKHKIFTNKKYVFNKHNANFVNMEPTKEFAISNDTINKGNYTADEIITNQSNAGYKSNTIATRRNMFISQQSYETRFTGITMIYDKTAYTKNKDFPCENKTTLFDDVKLHLTNKIMDTTENLKSSEISRHRTNIKSFKGDNKMTEVYRADNFTNSFKPNAHNNEQATSKSFLINQSSIKDYIIAMNTKSTKVRVKKPTDTSIDLVKINNIATNYSFQTNHTKLSSSENYTELTTNDTTKVWNNRETSQYNGKEKTKQTLPVLLETNDDRGDSISYSLSPDEYKIIEIEGLQYNETIKDNLIDLMITTNDISTNTLKVDDVSSQTLYFAPSVNKHVSSTKESLKSETQSSNADFQSNFTTNQLETLPLNSNNSVNEFESFIYKNIDTRPSESPTTSILKEYTFAGIEKSFIENNSDKNLDKSLIFVATEDINNKESGLTKDTFNTENKTLINSNVSNREGPKYYRKEVINDSKINTTTSSAEYSFAIDERMTPRSISTIMLSHQNDHTIAMNDKRTENQTRFIKKTTGVYQKYNDSALNENNRNTTNGEMISKSFITNAAGIRKGTKFNANKNVLRKYRTTAVYYATTESSNNYLLFNTTKALSEDTYTLNIFRQENKTKPVEIINSWKFHSANSILSKYYTNENGNTNMSSKENLSSTKPYEVTIQDKKITKNNVKQNTTERYLNKTSLDTITLNIAKIINTTKNYIHDKTTKTNIASILKTMITQSRPTKSSSFLRSSTTNLNNFKMYITTTETPQNCSSLFEVNSSNFVNVDRNKELYKTTGFLPENNVQNSHIEEDGEVTESIKQNVDSSNIDFSRNYSEDNSVMFPKKSNYIITSVRPTTTSHSVDTSDKSTIFLQTTFEAYYLKDSEIIRNKVDDSISKNATNFDNKYNTITESIFSNLKNTTPVSEHFTYKNITGDNNMWKPDQNIHNDYTDSTHSQIKNLKAVLLNNSNSTMSSFDNLFSSTNSYNLMDFSDASKRLSEQFTHNYTTKHTYSYKSPRNNTGSRKSHPLPSDDVVQQVTPVVRSDIKDENHTNIYLVDIGTSGNTDKTGISYKVLNKNMFETTEKYDYSTKGKQDINKDVDLSSYNSAKMITAEIREVTPGSYRYLQHAIYNQNQLNDTSVTEPHSTLGITKQSALDMTEKTPSSTDFEEQEIAIIAYQQTPIFISRKFDHSNIQDSETHIAEIKVYDKSDDKTFKPMTTYPDEKQSTSQNISPQNDISTHINTEIPLVITPEATKDPNDKLEMNNKINVSPRKIISHSDMLNFGSKITKTEGTKLNNIYSSNFGRTKGNYQIRRLITLPTSITEETTPIGAYYVTGETNTASPSKHFHKLSSYPSHGSDAGLTMPIFTNIPIKKNIIRNFDMNYQKSNIEIGKKQISYKLSMDKTIKPFKSTQTLSSPQINTEATIVGLSKDQQKDNTMSLRKHIMTTLTYERSVQNKSTLVLKTNESEIYRNIIHLPKIEENFNNFHTQNDNNVESFPRTYTETDPLNMPEDPMDDAQLKSKDKDIISSNTRFSNSIKDTYYRKINSVEVMSDYIGKKYGAKEFQRVENGEDTSYIETVNINNNLETSKYDFDRNINKEAVENTLLRAKNISSADFDKILNLSPVTHVTRKDSRNVESALPLTNFESTVHTTLPIILYHINSPPISYDDKGRFKSIKISKMDISNDKVDRRDYRIEILPGMSTKVEISPTFAKDPFSSITKPKAKTTDIIKNQIDNRYQTLMISTKSLHYRFGVFNRNQNMPSTTPMIRKKARTVRYNTYKPNVVDDIDLPIKLEMKSTRKPNILNVITQKTTSKPTRLYTSTSVNQSVNTISINKSTKLVKSKFNFNKIENKTIQVHANVSRKHFANINSNKQHLLYPFSKTNMYPVRMMPPHTQRKVLKRIQFSNKKKNLNDANNKFELSPRIFTPKNIERDISPYRKRVFIPKAVTSIPRQIILRPKFETIDEPLDYFRPKPLFIEHNDNLYGDDSQIRRKSSFNWKKKISNIQDALKQFGPKASLAYGATLERPSMLPSYTKPKYLRDRIDSIRSYLYKADFVKTTEKNYEHEYFLKTYGDDDDKSSLIQSRRDNEKIVETTTAKRRTARQRRTLFFLSPTVPYNKYF